MNKILFSFPIALAMSFFALFLTPQVSANAGGWVNLEKCNRLCDIVHRQILSLPLINYTTESELDPHSPSGSTETAVREMTNVPSMTTKNMTRELEILTSIVPANSMAIFTPTGDIKKGRARGKPGGTLTFYSPCTYYFKNRNGKIEQARTPRTAEAGGPPIEGKERCRAVAYVATKSEAAMENIWVWVDTNR